MSPLSQALREALEYSLHDDVAKDERDEYGKFVKTHYYLSEERLQPIHKALCEAVEALERYAHLHIANDERNASSAPSNQYSPAAEALGRLRELVGK